ncbi:MAG: hypothetical protein WBP58_02525 [Chitinophagaceae bacterium]
MVICLCCTVSIYAQTNNPSPSFPVQPSFAEGLPIRQIIILLVKDQQQIIADSLETDAFQSAFQLRPGSVFRQSFAEQAIEVINRQPEIESAEYTLYNASYGDPLIMVVRVTFLKPGEQKKIDGKSGVLVSKSKRDFPVLFQSERAQLSIIANGGIGLYNENNAFFSKGAEFTKGNPVATKPAGKGVTFWGEAYLEPGLSAITELGKSKIYAYGAASVLISGRNTTDIYSEGSAVFAAFERLYAGILFTRIGKKKDINIDISGGRQFFQLNDGFLIAKFSGSANAGERGSVYLNSRTAFQKTFVARSQIKNWHVQAFFIEPQELFKDKQSNTQYTGGSAMYNNNKWLDAGLSYITVTGGTAQYSIPSGTIAKKGMYIINPKLWISDIAGTGIFLKSEWAYQAHTKDDMRSQAWYLGAGIQKKKWTYQPTFYYRFAFMQGDDSSTTRYERFDPILTGGLGNWVQGINFRKIVGNGNIISHRVEAKANFSRQLEVSADYFLLQANTLQNQGGLAPIAKLADKVYGHEITITGRYFISSHFLFLTVLSYASPGKAIQQSFPDPVYPWTSIQGAIFMFF